MNPLSPSLTERREIEKRSQKCTSRRAKRATPTELNDIKTQRWLRFNCAAAAAAGNMDRGRGYADSIKRTHTHTQRTGHKHTHTHGHELGATHSRTCKRRKITDAPVPHGGD